MSVITNNLLQGDDGYNISRSVRLRSSASAYFNRTPASAGSRTTWTMSMWAKRGGLGATNYTLFSATGYDIARFSSPYPDSLEWEPANLAGYAYTPAVFRDPSAWYHIVFTWDSTNATAANRMRIYVNGVLQTLTFTVGAPAQNTQSYWNSNVASTIGAFYNATQFFDGYLTEVNFIDGQALTPSSFGETDAATGVWKPKKYTGTYGTNGFFLNFSDNSNNTAATIGKDSSGNGNNWTPNNISVTSGSTYDSMLDVPTRYADGGNGRGNYAVINPLDGTFTDYKPTNGNLTQTSGSNWNTSRGNWGMSSGKWYWETVHSVYNQSICGIADKDWPTTTYYPGYSSTGYSAGFGNAGYKYVDGAAGVVYGTAFTTGDVIGYALDMDAGTLTCYINGTSQGTMVSGLTAYGTIFPAIAAANGATINANFGQRPFAYTPPTGFKALNTQNLPDATIKKGNAYFDASLYTGNSSTQSVTNSSGFQPDLLWIKARSGSGYDNVLQDSVRGSTNQLFSNTTGIEESDPDAVTSFNSNGFSLGGDVTVNNSGVTFVGWQWKESVSAGFDIVTYTFSTAGTNTINHSLGVAPKMIIMKDRTTGYNWDVYHASVGYTQRLILNSTGAATSGFWAAAPTSTQFSVTNTAYNNNDLVVAYLFAEVAGYSKFGSYTGNGSTDGTFVYLGFRPRFIMTKSSSGVENWLMLDTARDTYNPESNYLKANTSDAEASAAIFDVTANGFKLRTTGGPNTSGGTYIYAAFAENPFKNALAR